MSTAIYYFSASGNSLDIARQVAKKLDGCEIRSMASEQDEGQIGGSGDSIGFVFPSYFIGLPRIVKRFIERLDILPGTYCFAITNYRGFGIDTLGMLQDVLKAKGMDLSYGLGVRMPGTYLVMYEAPDEDKVRKVLLKAEAEINKAIEDIAEKKKRPIGRAGALLTKIANRELYKAIAKWDEEFCTNSKCTGCGLCADVCPASNIKIVDRQPIWQHHCERCLACIHWCPKRAIEYGKKTIGRRRYHNPNVTVKDIIAGRTRLINGQVGK